MTRVELKLTLPRRGSLDGQWHEDKRNYTLARSLASGVATRLDGRTGSYSWPIG